MNVDLTMEELESVIQALKEHVAGRRAAGDPTTQSEGLIARLEQHQRDQRRRGPEA